MQKSITLISCEWNNYNGFFCSLIGINRTYLFSVLILPKQFFKLQILGFDITIFDNTP